MRLFSKDLQLHLDFLNSTKPFYMQIRFDELDMKAVERIAKSVHGELKRAVDTNKPIDFEATLRKAIERATQGRNLDYVIPADTLFRFVASKGTQGTWKNRLAKLIEIKENSPEKYVAISYRSPKGATLLYKGKIHKLTDSYVTLRIEDPKPRFKTFSIVNIAAVHRPNKVAIMPVLAIRLSHIEPNESRRFFPHALMRLELKVVSRAVGWHVVKIPMRPRKQDRWGESYADYASGLLRREGRNTRSNAETSYSQKSNSNHLCNGACKKCDLLW